MNDFNTASFSEEGLDDPLDNVEQFNIIQFLQAEGEWVPV